MSERVIRVAPRVARAKIDHLSAVNASFVRISQHTHIHHPGNTIQMAFATITVATLAFEAPRAYPLSA